MTVMSAAPTVSAAYTTAATSKGQIDSSLSAQWARRPADQRFETLELLAAAVNAAAEESAEAAVEPSQMMVRREGNNLLLEGPNGIATPTHWSFGQLATLTGTPADYLRSLAEHGDETSLMLAQANLQLGLKHRKAGLMQSYTRGDTLRAMTSTKYGRILDRDVVGKVQTLVAQDPRWKVPGTIDWSSAAGGLVKHNPFIDITKDNTTLYASDRDVFVFLCQDANPIEVGKLDNGQPDLMFRGFIISNSDVGAQSFSLKTMLLRGVCMNRNLWGCEDVHEVSIRHIGAAPEKFEEQAMPALLAYANASTNAVVEQAKAAKQLTIAKTEGERLDWLLERKLIKTMALAVMARVSEEEGHPMTSLYDACHGLTAYARRVEYQDRRIKLEEMAASWMKKVTVH